MEAVKLGTSPESAEPTALVKKKGEPAYLFILLCIRLTVPKYFSVVRPSSIPQLSARSGDPVIRRMMYLQGASPGLQKIHHPTEKRTLRGGYIGRASAETALHQ